MLTIVEQRISSALHKANKEDFKHMLHMETVMMPRRSAPSFPASEGVVFPVEVAKAEFGRRLQRLMAEKGLNQAELSRRLGERLPRTKIGRDSVSKYVRGLNMPGGPVVEALCKVLGVKREDLVPAHTTGRAKIDNAPLDVRDAGDGMAWLRVNQAVPWDVALQIMKMLKEEPREASGRVR